MVDCGREWDGLPLAVDRAFNSGRIVSSNISISSNVQRNTMSQDVPPSRGLVAGKYELLRLIGRGGMGSVWEGRHSSLGTHVAIKFIEKEYADNEEARKRFDTEARAAATLQSKHAIQIHDHGVTEDGKPYIVMELLIGEALDKRLERVKVITLRETAFILQQVCRGLQKAHDNGIVHRDLKPENVFLVRNADDDEEVAKVLDFGIAKIRTGGADQGVSANTRTGAVLGTPFYMSPEQARGLRDIDHRTDLWSLGVIAFRCTTGRLPFEGESLGDLLVKICTVPIPIPSMVNPQLPPSFDAWFSRALDRDPNRRFGSASEFAEALAFAAGLSVKRPTPAYGPASALPTQQPAGYTGTAMGGVSPAPYYAATPAPYGMQPQYPMNVTSPPFVSKGLFVFAAIAGLVGLGLAGYGAKVMLAKPAPTPVVAATSHSDPPGTAVVTPLTPTTVTTANTVLTPTNATAGSNTTTPNQHVTANNQTGHPHPTGTNVSPPPTNTAVTPPPTVTYAPTAAPTVTYTPAPTTHPTTPVKPGDFGAGF